MMTIPLHHTRDEDLAAHMLTAVAHSEAVSAAHERTKGQLTDTKQDLLTARRERDNVLVVLDAVRAFHDTWGDTVDAELVLDNQALWDDLNAILNPILAGPVSS